MLLTGRQITAARALLGWTQQKLADAAGLHPNAVGYWEGKAIIPTGSLRVPVACARIEKALLNGGVIAFGRPAPGVRICERATIKTHKRARARARHGVPAVTVVSPLRQSVSFRAITVSTPSSSTQLYVDNSPLCGARTRKGTACQAPGMRNGRCKLHGGLSTGARTKAGKMKVDEARARRWSKLSSSVARWGTGQTE